MLSQMSIKELLATKILSSEERMLIYNRVHLRFIRRAKLLGKKWKKIEIDGKNFNDAYRFELFQNIQTKSLGHPVTKLKKFNPSFNPFNPINKKGIERWSTVKGKGVKASTERVEFKGVNLWGERDLPDPDTTDDYNEPESQSEYAFKTLNNYEIQQAKARKKWEEDKENEKE